MVPVDIDVWLNAERTAELVKVIPYVRTAEEMKVDYRIELLRKGTTIRQSGSVQASATAPAKMGAMTVNANSPVGTCSIVIVLQSGGENLGEYRFDCPS